MSCPLLRFHPATAAPQDVLFISRQRDVLIKTVHNCVCADIMQTKILKHWFNINMQENQN